MKKFTSTFLFVFVTFFSFAQPVDVLGKWQFEKIPEHTGIDEEGSMLAKEFLKNVTLSFNETHYEFAFTKNIEVGQWQRVNDSTLTFTNDIDVAQEVHIYAVEPNQLGFKYLGMELQFRKTTDPVTIDTTPIFEALKTVIPVREEDLVGTWFNNGMIGKDKTFDIPIFHKENELANYEFTADGKFINRAIFEFEQEGTWTLDPKKQLLIIDTEGEKDYLKVVKLTKDELHLYLNSRQKIAKFKR